MRAAVSRGVRTGGCRRAKAAELAAEPTAEPAAEATAEPASRICVGGGWLTLSPKPPLAEAKLDKHLVNVTCVAVLLKEDEDWGDLQTAYESRGLDVIWLPLSCSKLEVQPMDERDERSLREVSRIRDALQEGQSVLIHCSAGLHRTGIVAYMVLRMLGLSREDTLIHVSKMREVTGKALAQETKKGALKDLAERLFAKYHAST